MEDICEYNKCTGCAACVNACAHNCITLEPDKYGELHPVIDQNSCVDCKLCQKACPNHTTPEFNYPQKCLASWIEDKEKRKICASGGIGTIISEYVIKNNGVVFGSRYDAKLNPIITYAESLEELEYFKGSRYVQSIVGPDTYKRVKDFLTKQRSVVFIGTPCQVAGLKSFLRKDYDNLLTVDLICHGVCPTSYFNDEIQHLSKKYNLQDVTDARFRGNDGNNYHLTLWNSERKKLFPRDDFRQKITYSDESQQYYIKGFLLGVSLRENCYTCNYARPERVSDITIGDFIWLGKYEPFPYSKENVSSVLINTDKGLSFYQAVSDNNPSLKNIEREYSERLRYKPSLVAPFERHPLNARFRELYQQKGFVLAIRDTLRKKMRHARFSYFRKLPKKVFRKTMRSFQNHLFKH